MKRFVLSHAFVSLNISLIPRRKQKKGSSRKSEVTLVVAEHSFRHATPNSAFVRRANTLRDLVGKRTSWPKAPLLGIEPQAMRNIAVTVSVIKLNASSAAEISRRIEELAHEYQGTLRGGPRREEIANEISALSLKLQQLQKKTPSCNWPMRKAIDYGKFRKR
jgi:hypothetical protein